MIEFLSNPWPWYVGGPIIGLLYLVLHIFGKRFGISSTLRTTCTMLGAGKVSSFFDYDWKQDSWNLFFIGGSVLGAFLAVNFLSGNHGGVSVAVSTKQSLELIGIESFSNNLVPSELFSFTDVTYKRVVIWVLGGFLVGFGTRYAGGCTSGHAISGLSNLQVPSLVAVIGFFIGGLFMTHFVLEILFKWAI